MPAMNNKKIEQGDIEKLFENLAKEIGEPVDFELPDWLNKWKPNYTIIRRNIYLTTQKVKRRVRVEDDGIFCSCSSTPGSSGVCGVDCHCGMLLSSCSSNCKCDESCLNKPFHQRPMKKSKIVQTEKCGSGVVAEEDIMQGEFVIEYVGEVIDDKTCEERLWRMKRQGETNFYLCEINRDMVIDARYKGNKSRYINHSCSPNTEMQKWRIDGETRIGIFATRDIKRGEHLTYDYQFMQFVADQDCHCGAVDCRRKLGVKPNKSNAALKIVACQVAINSSKVKAVLSGKDAYKNGVRQAAKFEDLAPPTQDSEEKIRKFLEIPPINNTFQILPLTEVSGSRETEPSMSGSQKSSSHFALHDIDCMLTDASYIKKEEPSTKPRVPLFRSKIPPPSKKRKDSDVIGSEAFPILLEFKEAMRHSQMGIEQMSRSYVEKLTEIEDLKKVAVGKTQYYENKLAEQAAQLEELKAKHSKEIEDIKGDHGRSMEDLLVNIKRDAGIAILDARIKMAEEASSEGFYKSSWDLEFWKKARANLTGEDSAVEKDAEADKTGEEVAMEVTGVTMKFTEA